jgi:transcriptional regulator with XRE-family HTH domain
MNDAISEVDKALACNLMARRKALGLSQDELAERMVSRGFRFSQATVWRIESERRLVRITEAMALAECLGESEWTDLLLLPESYGQAALQKAREAALRKARETVIQAEVALDDARRSLADVESQASVRCESHEA